MVSSSTAMNQIVLGDRFHFEWGANDLLELGRKERPSWRAHISQFTVLGYGRSSQENLVQRSFCLALVRLEEGVISSPSATYGHLCGRA